jgi:hypothetical protein
MTVFHSSQLLSFRLHHFRKWPNTAVDRIPYFCILVGCVPREDEKRPLSPRPRHAVFLRVMTRPRPDGGPSVSRLWMSAEKSPFAPRKQRPSRAEKPSPPSLLGEPQGAERQRGAEP